MRVDGNVVGSKRTTELPGSSLSLLPSGLPLLHPETQVFEAMLEGWRNQMLARNLSAGTVEARLNQVRAFFAHTGEFPWAWTPALADEWFADLRSVRHVAVSTVRNYQGGLRGFCGFVTDPGYGWAAECERRFGSFPIQVINEVNSAAHVADSEAEPRKRAFTREELQALFDYADDQVQRRRTLGRKGWLTAFRDATLLKTAYAFGLRRTETRMLDVADFGPNPSAAEFGDYGVVYVRYGKAKRGSPPKRRSVLTVWPWIVPVLQQWFGEVRPLLAADNPAAWPSERAVRIGGNAVDLALRQARKGLGLDPVLDFHSLRRSYVTHLIEDGWDARFVQEQVGHEHASTTSLYTCVSSDYRTRTLRRALDDMVGQALTHARPEPLRKDHDDPTTTCRLLPLEAAEGDGRGRPVRHHRPDRAARRAWREPVGLPGPPAGDHPAGTAQPDRAGRAVRHPRHRTQRTDHGRIGQPGRPRGRQPHPATGRAGAPPGPGRDRARPRPDR